MVLKKVDNRIRVLIENGVQKRHRSLFVVVGDKGKDQVSYEIKFCLLLGLTVFTFNKPSTASSAPLLTGAASQVNLILFTTVLLSLFRMPSEWQLRRQSSHS